MSALSKCALNFCFLIYSIDRTPGSGLYDNLQQYNLPYAEAIFELDYFCTNPKPFFSIAQSLYPGNYKPNAVHYFCVLLHEKQKLLRMYTQNIDGLERSKYFVSTKTLIELDQG